MVKQQVGQSEVAEVVGAELELKPRRDAASLQWMAADALSMVPRLIEEGMASGVLTSAHPSRCALLLAATIRGIVGLVTSDSIDPKTLDELISDAATTFIRGNAPTP